MEQKIKEIYDFLCDDEHLYVLDKKYQDYIDKIYFEIFTGDKTGFDRIDWLVVIDGIIRFEYVNLINNNHDKNKENLINEYFTNIHNRRAEIIQLAELVDEYSNIVSKSNIKIAEKDYEDIIVLQY